MKRHLKTRDIAQLLNCSTKTVRRLVERGIIPAIQPGGPNTFIRFDKDDVLRAIREASIDGSKVGTSASIKESTKLPGPPPKWKKKITKKPKGN